MNLKQLGMLSMVNHIQDLLELMTTKDIPSNNPVKDYAAIYLKNYLVDQLGNKDRKPKAGAQTLLLADVVKSTEILL